MTLKKFAVGFINERGTIETSTLLTHRATTQKLHCLHTKKDYFLVDMLYGLAHFLEIFLRKKATPTLEKS